MPCSKLRIAEAGSKKSSYASQAEPFLPLCIIQPNMKSSSNAYSEGMRGRGCLQVQTLGSANFLLIDLLQRQRMRQLCYVSVHKMF
mmetsp:Transcript_36120/g.81324  ORF Transcript_36120/g.81324 Transcript_36120/m.81324 type:complete len:86 (+) Transcript_36120:183-440(+)